MNLLCELKLYFYCQLVSLEWNKILNLAFSFETSVLPQKFESMVTRNNEIPASTHDKQNPFVYHYRKQTLDSFPFPIRSHSFSALSVVISHALYLLASFKKINLKYITTPNSTIVYHLTCPHIFIVSVVQIHLSCNTCEEPKLTNLHSFYWASWPLSVSFLFTNCFRFICNGK